MREMRGLTFYLVDDVGIVLADELFSPGWWEQDGEFPIIHGTYELVYRHDTGRMPPEVGLREAIGVLEHEIEKAGGNAQAGSGEGADLQELVDDLEWLEGEASDWGLYAEANGDQGTWSVYKRV